mmetsp:Transcript_21376/g.59684  ORF Transcript_21376/g.59684 Transcript_21376/m.59684 type:complete len:345 (-) Transcript_21376:719-1753(-)
MGLGGQKISGRHAHAPCVVVGDLRLGCHRDAARSTPRAVALVRGTRLMAGPVARVNPDPPNFMQSLRKDLHRVFEPIERQPETQTDASGQPQDGACLRDDSTARELLRIGIFVDIVGEAPTKESPRMWPATDDGNARPRQGLAEHLAPPTQGLQNACLPWERRCKLLHQNRRPAVVGNARKRRCSCQDARGRCNWRARGELNVDARGSSVFPEQVAEDEAVSATRQHLERRPHHLTSHVLAHAVKLPTPERDVNEQHQRRDLTPVVTSHLAGDSTACASAPGHLVVDEFAKTGELVLMGWHPGCEAVQRQHYNARLRREVPDHFIRTEREVAFRPAAWIKPPHA